MSLGDEAVQVDLDRSYLTDPQTALDRIFKLASEAGLVPKLLTSMDLAPGNPPIVPAHFQYMCCPRSISDLSSKIGLGYIGPKVRKIIQSARFPVLMTAPAFKAWKSVLVLFDGSENAIKALRFGIRISERTGFPLDLFIQLENKASYYEERIRDCGLEQKVADKLRYWHQFDKGDFGKNLYNVPHDAIVIVGAGGCKFFRHLLFGSRLETIQATLTNNLLVCGPRSKVIFH